MKAMLMLCAVLVIAIPQMATADHIGVYSDCSGSSCTLAAGLGTSVVMHKFSIGSIGSRFKITFPAGTSVLSFNTTFLPLGDIQTDISVAYGDCLLGSFCIGTVDAILAPGGVCVGPADGLSDVIYHDCNNIEKASTGGAATVGSPCHGNATCTPLAVEGATWGSVKALYR